MSPRRATHLADQRAGVGSALIIAVLAVAVSAVVAVAILIGNFRFVANNPLPAATASPSDASPARSPTATPTPSATATPVPLVPCPKGNPNQRARHPVDGRVYGGNLSFEAQPTFEPAALESRFSFAYDVLQQTLRSARRPALDRTARGWATAR